MDAGWRAVDRPLASSTQVRFGNDGPAHWGRVMDDFEVTRLGDSVRQYVPAVPNPRPKVTAVEPCEYFCHACGGFNCDCQERRERFITNVRRIATAFRDDWYWYVALAAVVAMGVGSAWL